MLTLIMAYDCEGEIFPKRVNLFYVGHKDEVKDIPDAVQKAFMSWAGADAGAAYVRDNGANWGDALHIPDLYLRLHGLIDIGPVIHDQAGGFRLDPVCFDAEILVDHNECLLEF